MRWRSACRCRDPSGALGTPEASREVLDAAGFEVIDIVAETIEFTLQDLTLAWESNSRSAAHTDVQRLPRDARDALKHAYLSALAARNPGVLSQADLLWRSAVVRDRRQPRLARSSDRRVDRVWE